MPNSRNKKLAANPDLSKTLEELERDYWGEAAEEDTSLVKRAHRLRQKPLNEFKIDDLRFMLLQQIGVPFLLPLALNHLEANPLVAGNYYPGDLLSSVIHIDQALLSEMPVLMERIVKVVESGIQLMDQVPEDSPEFDAVVRRSLENFLRRLSN
jgi:hypothetical protein